MIFLVIGLGPLGISGQEFNPEIMVSGGIGSASEPALTLDSVGNVYVVWVEAGEVYVAAGTQPSTGAPLTNSGLVHTSPDIEVSPFGVATVVFSREDFGGEIYYVSNPGGVFGSPINLSQSASGDVLPSISSAPPSVSRNVVWIRDTGGAFPSVFLAVATFKT